MAWIKEAFTFRDMQRLMLKLTEHVKAFNGLTPAELGELLSQAEKCTFETGATIIKEGSVGNHMYVILDGEAMVTKDGADGKIELARLVETDSFGEMSMADNEVRSATVTALSPCLLIRINDQSLVRKPETAMKIYRNITHVLSARLRNTTELLAWRL